MHQQTKQEREILSCVYIGVWVPPVPTSKMLTQMQVKVNENHSISRVDACAALAVIQKVVHIEMHFFAFTLSTTNLLPFPFPLR